MSGIAPIPGSLVAPVAFEPYTAKINLRGLRRVERRLPQPSHSAGFSTSGRSGKPSLIASVARRSSLIALSARSASSLALYPTNSSALAPPKYFTRLREVSLSIHKLVNDLFVYPAQEGLAWQWPL
jgi:hypothetical protein